MLIKAIALPAALLLATAASAQDHSFQLDLSLGSWSNLDGGSGILSNGGINGVDDRIQSDITLSYARDFGNFTGVIALHHGGISGADSSLNTDDATSEVYDLTARALVENGAMTYGGFIGVGGHDDYGDSDEVMTYNYIGAEFSNAMSWGGYFAQVGFIDSADEYWEGTQVAPFVNVGGHYDLANDYALFGAFAYGGGIKYGEAEYQNRIVDLTLGASRDFGQFDGYVALQSIQISYEDGPGGDYYGDTFNSVAFGITYEFGGDQNHGSRLPQIGRWVAYNANEIE